MEQAEQSIKYNSGKPGFISGERLKVLQNPDFSNSRNIKGVHPSLLLNRNIEEKGLRGEAVGAYRSLGIFNLTNKVRNFIF
jgi:hypothetical protein